MGNSIEASNGDLSDAVAAYREALRFNRSSGTVQFHLAVALGKFCKKSLSFIAILYLMNKTESVE